MSNLLFWVLLVLIGAFDVMGLIEIVKSIRDAARKKDRSIVWPILSIVFSALVAVAKGLTPGGALFGSAINDVLFTFATVLAFIELFGYNVIVKWLYAIVDSFVKKVQGD